MIKMTLLFEVLYFTVWVHVSVVAKEGLFDIVDGRQLMAVYMNSTAESEIHCCFQCLDEDQCMSTSYHPGSLMCQLSTDKGVVSLPASGWTVYSRHRDWLLVFRLTSGIGTNPFEAWTNGVSVTTDDVSCMDLTSTACTQHYRHPVINSWGQLDIKKVKYSLYKDGQEVVYVIFDGQSSENNADWFNPTRILDSSWTDLATNTFNVFSIEGDISRTFYINVHYGGCTVDVGYTMVVMSQHHPCQFDIQASYPTILYAIGSTSQTIESGDIGKADFSAIFIQ